ncbi:hypothetical protein BCO37747_06905 [Burkholderia contaminans]|nr:hypothetical protein BCO23253_06539 [Burkholderia contaminans]VWD57814.1 hypothetical protein BCO37747_06905 [Burkholderia contaminans]
MRNSPTHGQNRSTLPVSPSACGVEPRFVVGFCGLFLLYVEFTAAWSGRMKTAPMPANCCVTGAM